MNLLESMRHAELETNLFAWPGGPGVSGCRFGGVPVMFRKSRDLLFQSDFSMVFVENTDVSGQSMEFSRFGDHVFGP